MSEMTRYEEMDNAALVERLCHAADDGAMYYLIFRRLNGKLCDEMARYGIVDEDARYDMLMDFFFYLRDGEHGDNPMPYASLMLIRDVAKLDGWMWRCFRYFLAGCYKKEKRAEELSRMAGMERGDVDEEGLFSLRELDVAIRLLELVNRSFSAPERYIFFSDLYAMKSGRNYEAGELAARLGCTPGNLRVMRHRLKTKIRRLLNESNV